MSIYTKIFTNLICCPLLLSAQYDDIKFERISVQQGLSFSTVTSILQDSKGFIWIGTEYGLNRYDGYTIKVFTHDPGESNSISDNWIEVIYEDPADSGKVLWIGTKGGLNKLDLDNEKFTHYLHSTEDYTSLSHNQVTSICKDKKGFLWIGTWTGGLNRFNRETGEFTAFKNDPKNPHSISDNRINSACTDNEGNLWAGAKGSLNKLNLSDNEANKRIESHLIKNDQYQFQRYYLDQTSPTAWLSKDINDILEDHDQVLWICSNIGLYTFDRKTNQFNRYILKSDKRKIKSVRRARSIFEDKEGKLWIATLYQGLVNINSERDRLTTYQHDPNSSSNFIPASNSISSAIVDHTGSIWAATFDYGVNKLIPNRKRFQNFKHIPGDTTSLSEDKITSICEDENGDLWVSTFDGIINKFDKDQKHFVQYPITTRHICRSQSGEFWFAAGRSFIKFNPKSGKYIRYVGSTINQSLLMSNDILTNIENLRSLYYVYEDREGTVWCLIGHTSSGKTIFQFDENKRQFIPYKILSDENISNDVTRIYEDRSGGLWFGTSRNGTIQRIINKNESIGKKYKFNHYKNDSDDYHSISSNIVNAFCEDKSGYLWIGTEAGLNKFNPMTKSFKCYNTKDGLSSDLIFAVIDDNVGNLWLGTNSGISKFDPVNETFRNYDNRDGLFSASYGQYGASCKSGELLFFGSSHGLTVFLPAEIRSNINIPNIVFTDFKIFNKSVLPGEQSPLKKSILNNGEITLSHDQSVFSFEFSALDFTIPGKNQYAYQMEGVDPDWVFTDASRRFATYTNLDAGEYIFKVKGSNNDGVWSEEGTSLKVIITPPWWRSNLAYMFYVFLSIFIVISIWSFQTNRMRMKQHLEMQNFESKKLREVDKLKSRFFANISHEFRTPLTLIKGPLKQIIDGEFTGNIIEQCKMMFRNSDRLLGLINQILDLSKLESGEMKLQVSETHIIKYLKGMVFSFASLAERKKINLQFKEAEESIVGFIDRDKLEKIITNLLSNAFKFTPEEGDITFECELRNVDKSKIENPPNGVLRTKSKIIEITITNTGTGIPPDRLGKIFDRFYQIDDNYKKDSEGTGIGLALTKELVESHHGEISVTSIPDTSTTFKIILPIDKTQYKEDEIVEAAETDSSKETNNLHEPVSPIKESPSRRQIGTKSSKISPATNILIVEDNPDVTLYISSVLENDYRILTAENGKEGLKQAIAKYPDLVISDVMMPEMDGFELCQKIKSDERICHIPVILLTAKADLDSKIDGLEFGADDYVTKPFEARELQIRSKNLIEQRRKLREKFSKLIDLRPEDIATSSMDEQLLKRLMSVFEDHLEEPDFGVENFAREVGISRVHLNRKLQALTNLSTRDFISTLRLQRAAQMLSTASGTVSEIAYKVGFNNLSHFSKSFRKHFGKLPSDFSEMKNKSKT